MGTGLCKMAIPQHGREGVDTGRAAIRSGEGEAAGRETHDARLVEASRGSGWRGFRRSDRHAINSNPMPGGGGASIVCPRRLACRPRSTVGFCGMTGWHSWSRAA